MIAMGREATMAEAITVQIGKEKKKGVRRVLEEGQSLPQTSETTKPILPTKQFKNDTPVAPPQQLHTAGWTAQKPVQPQPLPFGVEKKKQKPTQIIVVSRDQETGEKMETLIDKKKRKKVSKLKKAINEFKREKSLFLNDTICPGDEMYETIYETDTMADDLYNSPKEYVQYTKTYKPLLTEILHDLNTKPIQVTSDMLRRAKNQGRPDPL